jgi:hypothetical protein
MAKANTLKLKPVAAAVAAAIPGELVIPAIALALTDAKAAQAVPVVHMALIDALHAQCAASVAELTGIKGAVERANNEMTAARVGKLGTMASLWPKCEPITASMFDTQCRATMVADYTASKAFKSEGTINALISMEKVAIVALTHGTHMGESLMPNANESLRPYTDRVRLIMLKSDATHPALWKQTTNKVSDASEVTAADKAATSAADDAKGTPRTRALRLLCNGNLADMQYLDTLTASNMVAIRSLYAMLYPIKQK